MPRRRNDEAPLSLFAFQDIITAVTGIMVLLTLILALELTQRKAQSPTVQTQAVAQSLSSTLQDTQRQIDELRASLEQQTTAAEKVAGLTPASADRQANELSRETSTLSEDVAQLQAALQGKAIESRKLQQEDSKKDLERQAAQQVRREADLAERQLEELRKSNRVIYRQRPGSGKRAWLVDIRDNAIVVAPADAQNEQIVFEASTGTLNVNAFMRWATSRRQADREYFVLLVRPSGIEVFQSLDERLLNAGFDAGIDLIGAAQEILPTAS